MGVVRGVTRYLWGAVAGLLASWSGLFIAIVGAAIGAVVGLIGSTLENMINRDFQGVKVGIGLFHIVRETLLGTLGGFAIIYGFVWFKDALNVLGAMAVGAAVALGLMALHGNLEDRILTLRGYRRMSKREARQITPVLRGAAQRLGITETLPTILMNDTPLPGAWTYSRHIIVSIGMLDQSDERLGGCLAHELTHWRNGDPQGLLFAWMCAWPVIAMYNLGVYSSGGPRRKEGRGLVPTKRSAEAMMAQVSEVLSLTKQLFGVAVWVLVWPAAICMKLLIAPAIATASREHEYEADAAAKQAGYGDALAQLLNELSTWEPARTGWESVVNATHPPIELRLEALTETPGGPPPPIAAPRPEPRPVPTPRPAPAPTSPPVVQAPPEPELPVVPEPVLDAPVVEVDLPVAEPIDEVEVGADLHGDTVVDEPGITPELEPEVPARPRRSRGPFDAPPEPPEPPTFGGSGLAGSATGAPPRVPRPIQPPPPAPAAPSEPVAPIAMPTGADVPTAPRRGKGRIRGATVARGETHSIFAIMDTYFLYEAPPARTGAGGPLLPTWTPGERSAAPKTVGKYPRTPDGWREAWLTFKRLDATGRLL